MATQNIQLDQLGACYTWSFQELFEAEIECLTREIAEAKAGLATTSNRLGRSTWQSKILDLETDLDFAQRSLQAFQKGYEEIHLNPDSSLEDGYPLDPRPFHYGLGILIILGLPIAVLAFSLWLFLMVVFSSNTSPFVEDIVRKAFVTLVDVFIMVYSIKGLHWGLESFNAKALAKNNMPKVGQELIFKATLPGSVMFAYQKALESRVFDYIRIRAPKKAFESVCLGDPIIYGAIGKRRFLIVQFDLGQDLRSQKS